MRLHTITFDINSTTIGNVEWVTSTNSIAIETSSPIHGTGSLRVFNSAGQSNIQHIPFTTQGKRWTRVYFKLQASPNADGVNVLRYQNAANGKIGIRMRNAANGNKLQLYNYEDGAQVGSDSGSITIGDVHYLELYFDSTTLASTAVEARLDGVSFASGTIDITANPDRMMLGTIGTDTTFDCLFDSWALNDDAGSYQNSWPGEGETFIIRPDGMGSNDQWARGGTDSGSDNGQVDENPPTGATDYIESNTSGQIDDFTLEATPSAMASDDIVNWIGIGVQFAISSTTGADPDFKVGIIDSGNVDFTGNLSGAGATAYVVFQTATPRNYPTLANDSHYEKPGTSTPWDKSSLDAAQIRVEETFTDTHFIRVSNVWLAVEHKPATPKSLIPARALKKMSGLLVR